jgi:hypothetical protein
LRLAGARPSDQRTLRQHHVQVRGGALTSGSGRLVALLGAALVGCLADIPELTSSSGSPGEGGSATTVTTTSSGSTPTTWCDEEAASADFCADFDQSADVEAGWDERGEGGHIHIELDTSDRSPPSSAHIWVDEDAPPCSYAQLKKSLPEVASDPAFNFNFEFLAQIRGIVAELNWVRGSVYCQALVYVNDGDITLSLRDGANVVPTTGVVVPISEMPFGNWHELKTRFDRATRTFVFEYDGEERPATTQASDEWLAACADGDPEPGGMIRLNIGSYCVAVGKDMANDNHFDNVVFDFQ